MTDKDGFQDLIVQISADAEGFNECMERAEENLSDVEV